MAAIKTISTFPLAEKKMKLYPEPCPSYLVFILNKAEKSL